MPESEFQFVFAKSGAARKQHLSAIKSYRNQNGSSPFHHASVKAFSRAKGHSAVAAAAYRSGDVLVDQRTGEVHDYSRKGGTDESFILAPNNAPQWVMDRERLWNEAERIETRKNSQVAREVLVALPLELNHKERLELVVEYVNTVFTNKGIVCDIGMHDVESHNPHAHIMFTNRAITYEGFAEKIKQPKDRNLYFEQRREELAEIRQTWTALTNLKLEGVGSEFRIDHRSYKDRGIDQVPTTHLGKAANQLKQRNVESINVNVNAATKELNAVNAEIINLEKARETLSNESVEKKHGKPNVTNVTAGESHKEPDARGEFIYKLAKILLKKEKRQEWVQSSAGDREALIANLSDKINSNERKGKLNFSTLSDRAGIEKPKEPTPSELKEIRRIAASEHDRGDYADNLSYRAAISKTAKGIGEQYRFGQIKDLAEYAEKSDVPLKEKNSDFEIGE